MSKLKILLSVWKAPIFRGNSLLALNEHRASISGRRTWETELKEHQNAGFRIRNFKIFPRVTPRCGRDDPIQHPLPARSSWCVVTHTRPRVDTPVPPQFLGPAATPDGYHSV